MIADALATIVTAFSPRRDMRTGTQQDAGFWREVMNRRMTGAGVDIDERRAETFSAVWCATRLIAEGVACLPLSLRRTLDDRRTETASDHPVSRLVRRMPNPEMDVFGFLDMQVPLQVNYGNCYAEIQRGDGGKIEALWPIHPSRIPTTHIVRGPFPIPGTGTSVGADGELVYLVRSIDGVFPIPAKDMLHVPGVMSENGITGKGIVRYAAEALGVIGATEQHVGAFFRNGATPDIAVIVKGNVKPEQLQNLRESWKSMHGGSENAHRMMVLQGDTEVKTLSINPDDAQLIDGRKFGIAEVSRFWKVPLHFLSELDSATFNNIEVLNRNFLTQTLGPWLRRWELAMHRQLLSEEERETLFFKFNVNALLRGDATTRSTLYTKLFDMGVYSINEIRELEDLDAIDDGDRRFIAANNRVPLDRMDDIALLQQAKAVPDADSDDDEDDEDDSNKAELQSAAKGVLKVSLMGLMQYEARAAVRAAADSSTFLRKMEAFYADKFPDTFRKAVAPVLPALNAAGVAMDADDLLARHVARSMEELNATLDAPQSAFAATVQRTVDAWSNRYSEVL